MSIYRISYVFEIETDDPIYVWTGHGPLTVGGKTYIGAGDLITAPDIRQLINGVAERLEVTLSGVSAEGLRLIETEKDSLQFATARIGRIEFDEGWAVSGSVQYDWKGIADTIAIRSGPSDEGRVREIKVGFGSGLTRRSEAQLAYFTDQDQRRRSATDQFFAYTGQISLGLTRAFGPK